MRYKRHLGAQIANAKDSDAQYATSGMEILNAKEEMH
jgi:hypothetical protein